MTRAAATGYDMLVSRPVPAAELRAFLLTCFGITEPELFVTHQDRVTAGPATAAAVFCAHWDVSGDFATGLSLGVEARLAARVGRRDLAARFAAHFDAHVLHGDTEPPGLWTLTLADGTALLAAMDEHGDRYTLYAATAPVPGRPDIPVNPDLGQARP